MLDDAGGSVAGRVRRRVGDEEGMRFALPAFEEPTVLRADDLRGAGLSGHLHVGNGQRRAHGGAALLIDHGNHAGAHELEMHGIDLQEPSGLGLTLA